VVAAVALVETVVEDTKVVVAVVQVALQALRELP
jgi:hypothetical protein